MQYSAYAITPEAAAASERCRFDLRYSRAARPRRFVPGSISGEPLDNARDADGEEVDGGWDNGDAVPSLLPDGGVDENVTMERWIEHYAAMAITEAIHEGLEWLHVDEVQWLDPHGYFEVEIYKLSSEFAEKLATLRHRLNNSMVDNRRPVA